RERPTCRCTSSSAPSRSCSRSGHADLAAHPGALPPRHAAVDRAVELERPGAVERAGARGPVVEGPREAPVAAVGVDGVVAAGGLPPNGLTGADRDARRAPAG